MRVLIFVLICAGGLTGCNTLHPKIDTTSLHTFNMKLTYEYQTPTAPNYFRTLYEGASDKKVERNRIAFELMSVIDDNYGEFERNLREGKGYKDAFVSITSLILTGAASISTGQAPKILAAVDTGLKGSNAAVDKNLLGDHVPELLINKMRANRATVASSIYENMSKADDIYPLQAAVRDLMRYFQEGSVTSALTSLVSDTAKDADVKASEANKKQLTIQ